MHHQMQQPYWNKCDTEMANPFLTRVIIWNSYAGHPTVKCMTVYIFLTERETETATETETERVRDKKTDFICTNPSGTNMTHGQPNFDTCHHLALLRTSDGQKHDTV